MNYQNYSNDCCQEKGSDKPLAGVRVIESALQYPGPFCGMLLAQLGAEVVKLELPGIGDPARTLPKFFNSINCNKKSVTLNLKTTEGKKIFHRLIRTYDVFMEGFRPGVSNRLGIDYPTLIKLNPRLIYCSITGYGQDGPYRDKPGHDLNYQAISGLLGSCFKQPDNGYYHPGIAIADVSSGLFAAISILSALFHRKKTGDGTYIDFSMTDGLISLLSTHFGSCSEANNLLKTKDAGYGLFKTSDEKYIALGIAYEDWFWDRLCIAMGVEQMQGLNKMKRRQNRNELVAKLSQIFIKKTQKEWMNLFASTDIPVSAVKDIDEVLSDPHFNGRQMFQEIIAASGEKITATNYPAKFSAHRPVIINPPPELGQQTNEILEEHGWTFEEIQKLKLEGII